MKRQTLLSCMAVLAVLAFARPGLTRDLPEGKTAEQPKTSLAATTGSGVEANLGLAGLSSPKSLGSCPYVKCWIACDSGLGRTQYFTNTFACYSYSDAHGCHSSGVFSCSEKPDVAGC